MTAGRSDEAVVSLIEVPYDSGHRGRRMGAGPGHLVGRGLGSRIESAGYRAAGERIEAPGSFPTENGTTFELARQLSALVRESADRDAFPLVLAGNCASSLGTVAGLRADTVGVIWMDAHGDFNTPETTTSGFLDGMALSMLAGHCWVRMCGTIPGFTPVPERSVLLAGARDLDGAERKRLEASGVTTLRAGDVVEDGRLEAALEPVLRDVDTVYLHVDLDVLDPDVARANMYPAPGGLTVDAVREVVRAAGRRSTIGAAALTSYAPGEDPDDAVVDAAGEIATAILDAARLAG